MNESNHITELQHTNSLARWIHARLIEKYPSLKPSAKVQTFQQIKSAVLNSPMFWAILLSILLGSANEILIGFDVILVRYQLDSSNASEVLSSFVDVAVATLGIAIPIILLLVTTLGRYSGAVIDIYLEKTGTRRLAYTALIVAGVLLAVRAIIQSDFQFDLYIQSRLYLYTLFLMFMIVATLLWETAMVLKKSWKYLSTERFIGVFLERLRQLIRRSQYEEAKYRYSRVAQINFMETLDIRDISKFGVKPKHLPTETLVASKSGQIVDIDPSAWVQMNRLLGSASANNTAKGFVYKIIGDVVSEGEPIVDVILENKKDLRKLKRLSNKLVKITAGKNTREILARDISNLLDYLKPLTLSAIREQNDVLLEQYLDAYEYIIQLCIELPSPPIDSPFSYPFSDWFAMNLVSIHMRQIIEVAAQAPDERLLKLISYRLSSVLMKIIQQVSTHVPSSLQGILFLFAEIYLHSSRKQYHGSAKYAWKSLITAIEDTWIDQFESHYSNQQTLTNLHHVLQLVLDMLGHHIAREMVRLDDFNNLAALLRELSVKGIYRCRESVRQEIDMKSLELRMDIKGTSDDKKGEIEVKLQTLQKALNIWDDANGYFREMVFVLGSFALDSYHHDLWDSNQTRRLLEVIERYYGSFDESVLLFAKLSEWHDRRSWHAYVIASSVPDDTTASRDANYSLFFCYRGIVLLNEQKLPVPQISVLSFPVEWVESVCDEIAQYSSKWQPLLKNVPDIATSAKQFAFLCKVISKTSEQAETNRIAAAALDPQSLTLFQNTLTRIWQSPQLSFRAILDTNGAVSRAKEIDKAQVIQYHNWHPDKQKFMSSPTDERRFDQLSTEIVSKVNSKESQFVIGNWQRSANVLAHAIHGSAIQPYAEAAILELNDMGFAAHLILVPRDISYYFLSKASGFVPYSSFQVTNALPFLTGFYNKIPVIQVPSMREPNMLVVDVSQSGRLHVGDLQISVTTLSEEEVKQILHASPTLDERWTANSVMIKITESVRFDIGESNAILRIPLNLPPEMWLSPPR